MPPPHPEKACVFCGSSGELTAEHVFGAWLGRLGLPQEPSIQRAGPLNRSPREIGPVRPFNSTVRDVCASCNNGWMSNLEAAAARALPPLILGQGGAIESRDRSLIAAWTLKTALVNMLVSSKEERASGYGLPCSEYRALFEAHGSGAPLPDTRAWIARYDGERVRASACVTPVVLRIEGTAAPETPQGYLVTIVLGQLLLHLLRFTTPRLAVDASASDEFSVLWPTATEPVRLAGKGVDDNVIFKIERGAAVHTGVPGVSFEPWRPATELLESTLLGSMLKMPTPCGKHFIFYPARLASTAIQGISHAFPTSCECGKGYLVVTEADGAHFKLEGSRESVAEVYEKAAGEELTFEDDNGVFWFKRLTGPWVLPRA